MKNKEIYSPARGCDLGRSVYFSWNTLDDVIIPSWSRNYFGDKTNVKSESSRCEDDFHIELGNLFEQNRTAVDRLYNLYDYERDWDLEDDWYEPTNGKPVAFEVPTSISVRIISDYLQREVGFVIRAAIAVPNGVFFFEHEAGDVTRNFSIPVTHKKLLGRTVICNERRLAWE